VGAPLRLTQPALHQLEAAHTANIFQMIPGFGAGLVIETRSLPNLLIATLATLPSMSLIPSAPFPHILLRFLHFNLANHAS
jgi:hypothetical protein